MTLLQQALVHLAIVVVVVVAVVVLTVTNNLSTVALGVILGVAGFGSIGVAGTTPVPTTGAKVTP
jgi:hypothetical protein